MPITMRKAVEILDINVKEAHKTMPLDVREAICLAISTMNTVLYIRKGGEWSWTAPLPDEELEPK